MADDKDVPEDDRLTAIERMLARDLEEVDGVGKPLSRRARQTRRSVEAYLQAGVRPRWMERLGEIDAGIQRETRRLARAYAALREEHRGDDAAFARRWRDLARTWRFDDVNELIRQHNEWFPIERQLPIDPRTRDYVLVGGKPYRRAELGAEWILERFPAERT
jgi:hypothetical protein